MLRRVLNCTSAKTVFSSNIKPKNKIINLQMSTLGSKNSTSIPVLEIQFAQRRFCSSNFPGSAIHKVFFVNAESPTSTDVSISQSDTIEYIPPPPLPPEVPLIEESTLNALGEPTFQSLGLAGWTPVGLFQSAIEYLHVTLELPWWGSIAAITVVIRLCLFPLVVIAQRNAAKMNNSMPAIQRLQMKMTEARNTGNQLEAAKMAYELQNYMMKNEIKPMRNAMVPLAQAPIFISMFIGLRKCANLPVESMKEGGMLWFPDLTIADPFYGLPVITSLTMLATIEVGSEGHQSMGNQMSKVAKYVLRGLPLVVFPFIIQFPSAVLCYWVSTNFCSLLQVGFLKIPKVRTYFKIEPSVKHEKELTKNKKGVMEGIKESWSNMRVTSEIGERHKIDEIRFKKAGTAQLVKTYKHNPLKKNVIDVRAKPKDQ